MKSGITSISSSAQLFRYGALAFPLAFAGIPIYLHAPDFYAGEFDVSLATLGTTLLLLRIVDAVQDPLIGRYSDQFNKWRRSIMTFGLCLFASGFWMIFHPVASMVVLWFAISIFVCTTGFSIVSINFQALGGLWNANSNERTKITAWREAIGLLGLLAVAIAPPLLGSAQDPKAAFHLLSLVYLPILAIASWLFFTWMDNASIDVPEKTTRPKDKPTPLNSKWRLHFYGIYFLNGFGSSIPAVMVIFFVRDRLQAEEYLGLFLLLYFLSGALAMPLWQRLSKSVGKYRCWMFSIVLAVATFCSVTLLGPGDYVAYAVICVLSGAALGADLALPPSMLADHISSQNDQARASSYFSVMTFLSKGSLALATGIMLPALGVLGYQPGVLVSDDVTRYLSLSYGLGPSIVKVIVAFWIWKKLPLLNSLGMAKISEENAPTHQLK